MDAEVDNYTGPNNGSPFPTESASVSNGQHEDEHSEIGNGNEGEGEEGSENVNGGKDGADVAEEEVEERGDVAEEDAGVAEEDTEVAENEVGKGGDADEEEVGEDADVAEEEVDKETEEMAGEWENEAGETRDGGGERGDGTRDWKEHENGTGEEEDAENSDSQDAEKVTIKEEENSPEPEGDEFISIPVECDLQEESQSQETAEKQESESEYSYNEEEDSNDEDYNPRLRSRRSRKNRKEFDDDLPDETSEELRDAYRLFQDVLVCAGSHFLNHPTYESGTADYLDVIEKPMWLEEIKRRFLVGDYVSAEEFVADFKLVLENCYRYFGRDDPHTKKALRIEKFYTQKVAALPIEEREVFLLEPVGNEENGEDTEDSNDTPKINSRKGTEFHSSLLERFGDEKERREKEKKDALTEERKLAVAEEEKEYLEWERETLFANGSHVEMISKWEIPQISQILQLTRSYLCIEELPQYEMERMFLMPQSSKLLAILMTSLLSSPSSRPKLHSQPPMPYSIWSKKLAQRVAFWYKSYHQRGKNPLQAFEYLGIECEFWSVLGDWNQLEDYEFYELSFHQRVWIIKSLCDYLMHHHKTMHDILDEYSQEDQMCTLLGEDEKGNQYLHFPIFHRGGNAVRVYKQRPHIDNWAPEPVVPEKKATKKRGPKQSRKGSKKFGRGSAAKRKDKRNKEYDLSSFISRNIYRMPYNLHAGRKCKKRKIAVCGSTSETVSNPNSDKAETPFGENADCSATNSPDVSQDAEEFQARRSTRNKYQANYLDWSESDDETEQQESKRKGSKSKRAFSAISEAKEASKPHDRTPGNMVMFPSAHGSSIADDTAQDASLMSDEGASRSSLCKEGKSSLKGEESEAEEDDDDGMPDILPTKIEEDEDDGLWLTKSTGKKEIRRPRYDPIWLLQGTEDFELVADSVQGIRDLIVSFSDEDEIDLMHRRSNTEPKSNRTPEQRLKKALMDLVKELEPLELKLEKSARLSRKKLYSEWLDWKNRGEDFKDSDELYWLSFLEPVERAPPVLTPQLEPQVEMKAEAKKEEPSDSHSVSGEVENSNAPSETTNQSEDAEGEGRHSTRRSKRRVEQNGVIGDSLQDVWSDEMPSEESEGESDHDDSWEMPGKRKRKRTRLPKKRPIPKDGQEEGEQQSKKPKKKVNDKTAFLTKQLWGPEDGDKNNSAVKMNDGLHSKLTLDKQGNLFITMPSGERVPLEKDEEGKIKVPNTLPRFAVLNGKTLQQLFGENRVIPKAIRRKECSTTLFPALPLPTVYSNRKGVKEEKEASTSVNQSPQTPDASSDLNFDLMKLLANKVTVQKTKSGEQRVYPPSSKAKTKKEDDVEVIATPKPKPNVDADVVYLSDGSDDSIELIQESTPVKTATAKGRDGLPRIKTVVGNAKIDLPPTVKNISKSVTMSPVLPRASPAKNVTPQKDNQWKPVITNSRSLSANSSRVVAQAASPAWKGQRAVISNISPEVQITTTRKPTTQRNLSVYRTPNQAFVPVTSLPARPAQSNFVPINQFVPTNQFTNSNQFQPVTNQFAPANSPHFVPLNSQAMVQVNPVTPQPPRVRMLAGNTTITPVPPPRPQVQPQSSPTLSGQIVLVNTDKGFTYAVKLADGGTIFLTPEQVAKIREANSGKLTTMVTLHTN